MYFSYSEMLETTDPHRVELTKIAWVSANLLCKQYGMTIGEAACVIARPTFAVDGYLELRRALDPENAWLYDMWLVEKILKDAKVFSFLFPKEMECERIFNCLVRNHES